MSFVSSCETRDRVGSHNRISENWARASGFSAGTRERGGSSMHGDKKVDELFPKCLQTSSA